MRSRTKLVAGQVMCAVAIFGAWEWCSRQGMVDAFFVGSPSGALAVLLAWIENGTLLHDSVVTMSVLLLGWASGMAVGVLVGALLFTVPTAYRIVSPYLALLNATPRMIFYPFFGIALGFSAASKIGLVVFVIVVFAILNVLTGLAEVDHELVAHVRLVGGGTAMVLWNVYVPSLLGSMVASSRVTFAFALQATIISEFFGPDEGLGFRVVAGQGAFEINQVWAALSMTVALALLVDICLQLVQSRMTAWEAPG